MSSAASKKTRIAPAGRNLPANDLHSGNLLRAIRFTRRLEKPFLRGSERTKKSTRLPRMRRFSRSFTRCFLLNEPFEQRPCILRTLYIETTELENSWRSNLTDIFYEIPFWFISKSYLYNNQKSSRAVSTKKRDAFNLLIIKAPGKEMHSESSTFHLRIGELCTSEGIASLTCDDRVR